LTKNALKLPYSNLEFRKKFSWGDTAGPGFEGRGRGSEEGRGRAKERKRRRMGISHPLVWA